MKKFIILLLFFVSTLGYSQAKHYICLGQTLAFDTSAHDPRNLIGSTLEVGKYINTTSVGIMTGLYTYNKKDIYSELMVTVPVSAQTNFSLSAGMGWFYYHKDITMEYDINYVFSLNDTVSLITTLNTQSAFGTTTKSFIISINKDF